MAYRSFRLFASYFMLICFCSLPLVQDGNKGFDNNHPSSTVCGAGGKLEKLSEHDERDGNYFR